MNTIVEPADVLRRAHHVGTYYGFTPFAVAAHKRDASVKAATIGATLDVESLDPHARDVASFLKRVAGAGFTPSPGAPLFFWHSNAAAGRPAPKQIVVQFHAIGADRAIADAVLIRAVRALTADLSKGEPVVRLNSMGDKETRARLTRELGSFFRKRAGILPPDALELAKKDVHAAAETLLALEDHGMPSSTDHLSEASRKHFEALLEYLEATETPYELSPEVMSKSNAWSETCFSIDGGEHIRAWGSRYHELAKHFWKGAPSSIGAVIRINVVPKKEVMPPVKARVAPRFVFVHIGEEAKRASIRMADTLRHARIPLMQVLGVESLSEQMRLADELNPRYLIIMGRKEALERSVILRERATHAETFIPFDSLIDRLKAVG